MLTLESFIKESGSVDSAGRRGRHPSYLSGLLHPPSLSLRTRVCHPNTRTYVRLLGPCYKTGHLKPFCHASRRAPEDARPRPVHPAVQHAEVTEDGTGGTRPGGLPARLHTFLSRGHGTVRWAENTGAPRRSGGPATFPTAVSRAPQPMLTGTAGHASGAVPSTAKMTGDHTGSKGFPFSNFKSFSLSYQSSFHLSFTVLVRYRSIAHI